MPVLTKSNALETAPRRIIPNTSSKPLPAGFASALHDIFFSSLGSVPIVPNIMVVNLYISFLLHPSQIYPYLTTQPLPSQYISLHTFKSHQTSQVIPPSHLPQLSPQFHHCASGPTQSSPLSTGKTAGSSQLSVRRLVCKTAASLAVQVHVGHFYDCIAFIRVKRRPSTATHNDV